MKRGIATFTLDYGKCPPWLFKRMVKLGREMSRVLIEEYGPEEYIRRLADPGWFQSLGTVLAFDWNASGLTTILTAALKEAIAGYEKEWGVFICGGKGKTSRRTPDEITSWGNVLGLGEDNVGNLVYNSKMSAKVDSSLIQDGFQIYHHAFFFSRGGSWAVVQQGMNQNEQTARRYHWHSENIQDLIQEPHTAINSPSLLPNVLDITSKKSESNREISIDLIGSRETFARDIQIIRKHSSKLSEMIGLKRGDDELALLRLPGIEFGPADHEVAFEDFWESPYLKKIFSKLTHDKPTTYESFLATPGVGPKTVRAISLVSEIIYGAKPSYVDPARYSFAHGGKDATPYPVDRKTYDQTINVLSSVVSKTRLDAPEKDKMLKKLEHTKTAP